MNRSYEEAVEILKLLNQFFIKYQGKLTYHNAGYDVKQLIYMLFMKTPWDYEGLLYGLEVMTRNMDDTKIISYLATNSAAGNRLGLKQQAKEFLGKYSEKDIEDITKIPLPQLLQYNLKDCLGTWYTKEKNYPIMVADQQESVYFDVFKPVNSICMICLIAGLKTKKRTIRSWSQTNRNQFISMFSNQLLNKSYRWS
jgi:DNA polymerase-1